MTECAECGDDFPRTVVCSVCGDAYCLSHRNQSEHDCIETTKPDIRPLDADDWSGVSHVVNKVLFVVLSLSLILLLVDLLS